MDDGTKEMKAKLLNLIAKGKIARETQANIECCQSHDRGCLPCGIGVYQTGSSTEKRALRGGIPLDRGHGPQTPEKRASGKFAGVADR